jgi:hypothetical protein
MLESSKNASEATVVIPLFLCQEQSFSVAVVWIHMMNTVVLVHMMNTDERYNKATSIVLQALNQFTYVFLKSLCTVCSLIWILDWELQASF